MKKTGLLLLMTVCFLFVFGIQAKAGTGGNYEYTVNDDGKTITLDSYTGPNVTDLKIPSKINGYKVTKLDSFVFTGLALGPDSTAMSKITIPSTISEIGLGTFAPVGSLKKIEVDPKNKYFTAEDGVLFSKSMDTLVCCPAAKKRKIYDPR